MKLTHRCGHSTEVDPGFADIFGDHVSDRYCIQCRSNNRLYDAVYRAMAGNVYDIAMLAGEGLIPGSRPTLADLDRAGQTLFARLPVAVRADDLDAIGDDLAAIA